MSESAAAYRAVLGLDAQHLAARRGLARVLRRQGSDLCPPSASAVRAVVQAPPPPSPPAPDWGTGLCLRDTDGDAIEFRLAADGRLQELVNGSLELVSVGVLSYSAALGVVEDDAGDFEIVPEELPEKVLVLRVLAWRAGVSWYGDEPAGLAQCSLLDEEGDQLHFQVSPSGRLQEYVNGALGLERVQRLSYDRDRGCVTDDAGEFRLLRQERLEKAVLLRLLARHVGVPWCGDDPLPPVDVGLPRQQLPEFRVDLGTASRGGRRAVSSTPAAPSCDHGFPCGGTARAPRGPTEGRGASGRVASGEKLGGRLWEVVGGKDAGGLVVRAEAPLSSRVLEPRLSLGAVVQELEVQGQRLRYRRVSGSGPSRGWVSVRVRGKDLLVECGARERG
uniref:Uncharacterized protein n=1 Tax=Alexandrium monilatum TaxID=311494 RepID=A0A7S4V7W3_9DINO